MAAKLSEICRRENNVTVSLLETNFAHHENSLSVDINVISFLN